MYGIINYEVFLLTGIMLNITPGNDTIYILSKSISLGKKAGIASALGISVGSLIHTCLAALGLSIVIAKSLLLFNIIKYAGAVYLIYMGYKMILIKSDVNTNLYSKKTQINYFIIFRDGVITNVLNPKVALFFITFLPQFINANNTNIIVPFLLLGITFICTGTIWCVLLAFFASTFYGALSKKPIVTNVINKVCGLTLVGLGIKVAFTQKN